MSFTDARKARSLASLRSSDNEECLPITQGDELSDPGIQGTDDNVGRSDHTMRQRHTGGADDTTRDNHDTAGRQEAKKWVLWRTVMLLGSHELDNKGTVARDHLANERTYLAWLRTSLSFSSIGVAVAQLLRLSVLSSSASSPTPSDNGRSKIEKLAKPLGATLVGIGLVVVLLGARRYYVTQLLLTEGRFPVSKGSVMLTAALTVAIVAACLSAILAAIR